MLPFEYLGPYRVEKPLGRGGMGAVFSAVHAKSGERVAVKVIAQHLADEPRFRRRFDREVKALQRLRHPGIVRLIGFGEEQGQLFYSMELIEGETLQTRIRRLKKLDWQMTIDLAIQICAALKHAHDIGVTHRDLKPANLILTADESVKLVDFGIPKVFGDDGEQTMAGSVLGTADYMAPEQATGDGITARTDLYALGSVMYAMLTGRPPFTGKKATEVIESLRRDRPVPLDLVNPELPTELVELVHHLLEKDPSDRPPTALAVMNRLKAMRAGLSRDQTVVTGGMPTEHGVGSAAADTSGGESVEIPSEPTDPHDGSTAAAAASSSSPPALGSDSPRRVIRAELETRKGAPVSPTDVTVIAAPHTGATVRGDKAAAADGDGGDPSNNNSHFQTVDESTPTTSYFRDSPVDSPSRWLQGLSVAAMVAALALGTTLIVYALRPPTADQLYLSAIETGDSGAIQAFLTRFPDDRRRDELYELYMTSRLTSVLKRLRTQQKLGIKPLEPAEEGFLRAVSANQQNPQQAADKIAQWLNAFENSAIASKDPRIAELVELAQYERQRLEIQSPHLAVDPRVPRMIDELPAVDGDADPAQVRKTLEGTIATFDEMPWARPVVDEAQRRLQLLPPTTAPQGSPAP